MGHVSILLDEMGLDKMGLDEMGINPLGVLKGGLGTRLGFDLTIFSSWKLLYHPGVSLSE